MRTRAGPLAALSLTVATALAIGACGGSEDTAAEASADSAQVTVPHAQGETAVPADPRTVVFDVGVLSTLDSLGIEVAGVPEATYPESLSQFVSRLLLLMVLWWPRAHARVDDAGAAAQGVRRRGRGARAGRTADRRPLELAGRVRRSPRPVPSARMRSVRRAGGVLLAVGLCGFGGTACGDPAAPVAGEEAVRLEVPTGSQQAWCAGDGPAVVLVNGIGADAGSAQWLDVERALADTARVCRYDRPGTGRSEAPDASGRGADALDAELDAVVDHAAGDGPVVLVAHSFGGYLARVYADRHPARVGGLVFVDALDPSVGVLAGTGAAGLDEVAMADERLDLRDVEAAARAVTGLDGDPPVVVLVRGEGVTPAWARGQERLAGLSGRSESVPVPGTGHQIPSEAPAAVVSAVEDVLEPTG